MKNQSSNYKKIGETYVKTNTQEMELDDLHLLDEQIRCVLGDMDAAFRQKGFDDFKIVIYGRKSS